jgi:hypothetical protein
MQVFQTLGLEFGLVLHGPQSPLEELFIELTRADSNIGVTIE